MSDPKFVPVDLKEFVTSGALMAANERVLWRLGLALTYEWNPETDTYQNLHVRQWQWEDGHNEAIENLPDEITEARHKAFEEYVRARADTMPAIEAVKALDLL